MHRFASDGLEMWYGTRDAPAPDGTTEPRERVSVTVGVRPANPSNAVRVRYRVDGRGVDVIPARMVAHEFERGTQFFRAVFPTFWSGERVEYLPIVSCEGRRAPDPTTALSFPSSFRLAPALPLRTTPAARRGDPRADFPALLEHLVHAAVPLALRPEFVGDTPAGFVINWPPVSGTLNGSAFRASVIAGGEHQVIVRPDGIGVLSASVSVRTDDGVLIALHHAGTVDYGEDWKAWLPAERWPVALPVRTFIRLLTSAPRYRWLNRLHCLGVGEVRPAEQLFVYDMYAVR